MTSRPDDAPETWSYLCYTAGRPYDGYARGIVGGQSVRWPIRHKQMSRYASATVVEIPLLDEETALDNAVECSLLTLTSEAAEIAFWRSKGARVGTVLPSGEVSWDEHALSACVSV